jgi:hypothetical protein
LARRVFFSFHYERDIFRVIDNGYQQFGNWVERAALEVGR